jgi:hypothetical protein
MSTMRKPIAQMWDVAGQSNSNTTRGVDQSSGQQGAAGYQMPQTPQPQQGQVAPTPPAQSIPTFGGGNMFGLNNQAIQDAIAKWQAQNGSPQSPAVEEAPPAAEPPPPPPVQEPAPSAPSGFQPGSILANLYGGNASQSERLTNGLNYAQAPTYADLPKSSGDFEGDAQDGLFGGAAHGDLMSTFFPPTRG